MALPDVTERQHFLFKVPAWQVRGKKFLGMGRDETTAVTGARGVDGAGPEEVGQATLDRSMRSSGTSARAYRPCQLGLRFW
ncbi:MAG: hypothetical protein ACRDL8_17630, partial [Solirubrobacteraceae bacterium]